MREIQVSDYDVVRVVKQGGEAKVDLDVSKGVIEYLSFNEEDLEEMLNLIRSEAQDEASS